LLSWCYIVEHNWLIRLKPVKKALGKHENFTSIAIYVNYCYFRFSLLLLEPSEIYFEDFSVFYYPAGLTEDEAVKR
jgi:hypothetical protein